MYRVISLSAARRAEIEPHALPGFREIMRRKRAPELGPDRFIVRRDEHERALSRLRRHVALWPQVQSDRAGR